MQDCQHIVRLINQYLDAQAAVIGRYVSDLPYARLLSKILEAAAEEQCPVASTKMLEFVFTALECGSFGEEGKATDMSSWDPSWTLQLMGRGRIIIWAPDV